MGWTCVGLKSKATGCYVRVSPGLGKYGLGARVDQQTFRKSYEALTMIDVGDGRVIFGSMHGTFLAAHAVGGAPRVLAQNDAFGPEDDRLAKMTWAVWEKIDTGGGFFAFRAADGSFLATEGSGQGGGIVLKKDRRDPGITSWTPDTMPEAQWTIDNIWGIHAVVPRSEKETPFPVVSIQSVKNGNLVRAAGRPSLFDKNEVDQQTMDYRWPETRPWETWSMIDCGDGKVAFRSIHGSYLTPHGPVKFGELATGKDQGGEPAHERFTPKKVEEAGGYSGMTAIQWILKPAGEDGNFIVQSVEHPTKSLIAGGEGEGAKISLGLALRTGIEGSFQPTPGFSPIEWHTSHYEWKLKYITPAWLRPTPQDYYHTLEGLHMNIDTHIFKSHELGDYISPDQVASRSFHCCDSGADDGTFLVFTVTQDDSDKGTLDGGVEMLWVDTQSPTGYSSRQLAGADMLDKQRVVRVQSARGLHGEPFLVAIFAPRGGGGGDNGETRFDLWMCHELGGIINGSGGKQKWLNCGWFDGSEVTNIATSATDAGQHIIMAQSRTRDGQVHVHQCFGAGLGKSGLSSNITPGIEASHVLEVAVLHDSKLEKDMEGVSALSLSLVSNSSADGGGEAAAGSARLVAASLPDPDVHSFDVDVPADTLCIATTKGLKDGDLYVAGKDQVWYYPNEAWRSTDEASSSASRVPVNSQSKLLSPPKHMSALVDGLGRKHLWMLLEDGRLMFSSTRDQAAEGGGLVFSEPIALASGINDFSDHVDAAGNLHLTILSKGGEMVHHLMDAKTLLWADQRVLLPRGRAQEHISSVTEITLSQRGQANRGAAPDFTAFPPVLISCPKAAFFRVNGKGHHMHSNKYVRARPDANGRIRITQHLDNLTVARVRIFTRGMARPLEVDGGGALRRVLRAKVKDKDSLLEATLPDPRGTLAGEQPKRLITDRTGRGYSKDAAAAVNQILDSLDKIKPGDPVKPKETAGKYVLGGPALDEGNEFVTWGASANFNTRFNDMRAEEFEEREITFTYQDEGPIEINPGPEGPIVVIPGPGGERPPISVSSVREAAPTFTTRSVGDDIGEFFSSSWGYVSKHAKSAYEFGEGFVDTFIISPKERELLGKGEKELEHVIGGAAHDLWEFTKRAAKTELQLIIKIGEFYFHCETSNYEAVVESLSWVWGKLKVAMRPVLEWLADFFQLDEIWRTKDLIEQTVLSGLEVSKKLLPRDTAVKAMFSGLRESLNGREAFPPGTTNMNSYTGGGDSLGGNDPKVSWLSSQASGGSFNGATDEPGDINIPEPDDPSEASKSLDDKLGADFKDLQRDFQRTGDVRYLIDFVVNEAVDLTEAACLEMLGAITGGIDATKKWIEGGGKIYIPLISEMWELLSGEPLKLTDAAFFMAAIPLTYSYRATTGKWPSQDITANDISGVEPLGDRVDLYSGFTSGASFRAAVAGVKRAQEAAGGDLGSKVAKSAAGADVAAERATAPAFSAGAKAFGTLSSESDDSDGDKPTRAEKTRWYWFSIVSAFFTEVQTITGGLGPAYLEVTAFCGLGSAVCSAMTEVVLFVGDKKPIVFAFFAIFDLFSIAGAATFRWKASQPERESGTLNSWYLYKIALGYLQMILGVYILAKDNQGEPPVSEDSKLPVAKQWIIRLGRGVFYIATGAIKIIIAATKVERDFEDLLVFTAVRAILINPIGWTLIHLEHETESMKRTSLMVWL